MTNEFNITLKNLRKSKGITQEQLAEAVGVSPQAVSKWEMNGYPDTPLLPMIADYLGVTIDELFGNKMENIAIENRVMECIKNLPREEQFKKIMDMERAALCGLVGLNEYYCYDENWRDEKDDPFDKDSNPSFSQIESDNGFVQIRLGKKLNYCLVMPEYENGYDDLLRYNEEFIKLYRFFSIPNALRAMYFFAGNTINTYFTVNSVMSALGIDKKNAEEIIKGMTELSFANEASLNTGSGEKSIYHYVAGINFISFMMFSYNLLNMPRSYSLQSGQRNYQNLYFKHDTYKIKETVTE
ncbi:MAG: helix-turn-helix transcriptional regulator [Ruminococcaceae bacterium]|nr:helix-turn-helix transcriptional regulator [Oscillospiraceae bacterium]